MDEKDISNELELFDTLVSKLEAQNTSEEENGEEKNEVFFQRD